MQILRNRITIATHNAGKLREFAELLQPYIAKIISAGELGLPAPEETGTTFTENALLKAKMAAEASDSLSLADDSGLCINALNGQPGIFSARWAHPTSETSIKRVLNELKNADDRSAYFICVLALYWPGGKYEIFEGRIDGTIAAAPRGTNGHGYDPIFISKGYNVTFAEISDAEKNGISHRGLAIQKLIERFQSLQSVAQ